MLISINPNNETNNPPLSKTNILDIPLMVNHARNAFPTWTSTPLEVKKEKFRAIVADIEKQIDHFAELMHCDMGKPLEVGKGEVLSYINGLEQTFKTMEEALKPDLLQSNHTITHVHWVAHGVAAIITPWNFPFGMPWSLLIPCLLAGNTVLFKPSEISSHTAKAMFEIMQKHLPPHVIQLIIGDSVQGKALVEADIDFVGFVGSQATGKFIRKATTDRMARILLELGGKDPMIIANDADLEKAASYAVIGSIRNTGQVCVSVERIYVESKIYDRFVSQVLELTKQVEVLWGNNERKSDPKPKFLQIGPLSNKKQLDHVLWQINEAIEKGATLHLGGKRISCPGYFIEPTVLTDVTPEMSIMKDETFGPVVCIQKVESLEQAVALSNNTRYGLAGTIWTSDLAKAQKLALQMECGLIGINRTFGGNAATPWTGTKESGFGYTGGMQGTRTYLQPRSITKNP